MLSRVGTFCESRLNMLFLIFILDISKLPQIKVSPNIVYEDILKVRNIVINHYKLVISVHQG